jgi:hypothetical protein
MKNFKEKEVKDLASINGGIDGTLNVKFTVKYGGFFDGSLFTGAEGQKVNETIKFDKLDVVPAAISGSPVSSSLSVKNN